MAEKAREYETYFLQNLFLSHFFEYNYYNLFIRHVIFLYNPILQQHFSSRKQQQPTTAKRKKERNETKPIEQQSNKVG